MNRRSTLLGLFSFAAAAGVGAQDRHWLVGTWEGAVEGLASTRGRPRTLIVDSVAADGRVRGGWTSDPVRTLGRSATIRVEGDTVRIRTQDDHTVTLNRVAADRLEGVFTSTGTVNRTYPIAMVRG